MIIIPYPWAGIPMHHRRSCPASFSRSASASVQVRFLRLDDLDTVMALERRKWTQEQSASREDLARRIARHPSYCIGAFSRNGHALASLFLKPLTVQQIRAAASWAECMKPHPDVPNDKRALFGISLSSIDPAAVQAIFIFFWPHALKQGWRDIYLGSPLPGLRAWQRARPETTPAAYAQLRRGGLPLDPQLRYYHARGFRTVVSVKNDYFPHDAAMDTAALLHARIPMSFAAALWRKLPLRWTQWLTGCAGRLL